MLLLTLYVEPVNLLVCHDQTIHLAKYSQSCEVGHIVVSSFFDSFIPSFSMNKCILNTYHVSVCQAFGMYMCVCVCVKIFSYDKKRAPYPSPQELTLY